MGVKRRRQKKRKFKDINDQKRECRQQQVWHQDQEDKHREARLRQEKREQKLNKEWLEAGLEEYQEKERRKKIIEEAKKTPYSPSKITQMEVYINEWNADIVTEDVLDEFVKMEEHIKSKKNILNSVKVFIEEKCSSNSLGGGGGSLEG